MNTLTIITKLIAEVQYEDINLCMADGSEITCPAILEDLEDCARSGDVEAACLYMLEDYDIEWRTVRCVSREPLEFANFQATEKEITQAAETLYFESETDFTDQTNAKMYLIWQAANDYESLKE